MKKILLLILAIMVSSPVALSQAKIKIKNHNLIFSGDIASGNLYTIGASSALTGLINYYVLNDAFFENSFAYDVFSTNTDGLKANTYNPMGLSARELFNNLQVGLKLGYQTYTPDFFNYGFYASGHYKISQFEVGTSDENKRCHRAQRFLLGGNALISLGSMEQAARIVIEAGCRYSFGVGYHSPLGDDKGQLADGLTSHFAIKLASRGMMQNLGVYADLNHFNFWKDLRPNKRLNNWTIGICWTITPQQVDDRNDIYIY